MSSFIKAVPLSQLSKYSSADDQIVLLSSTNEQPDDAAEFAEALGDFGGTVDKSIGSQSITDAVAVK